MKFRIASIVFCILLSLSLCVGGYKLLKYTQWQRQQLVNLENVVNAEMQQIQELKQTTMALPEMTERGGAYAKIQKGLPISILIVGDSIGYGTGASDDQYNWPSIIERHIETKYNVEVNVDNISMGGESSLAGYARLLQLAENVRYDLVFVCYGQNDPEEDFELYYEALIRRIISQFPSCSIIAIQEHPQREYTDKMNSILKIANYYRIPVVDTIQPFQEYVDGYDSLVYDGTHPNDLGYSVFADAVEKVLDREIECYSNGIGYIETPKNREASFFDNSMWLSVDSFARDGLTYSVTISEDIVCEGNNAFGGGNGVMMFVGLSDFPEKNHFAVYNNDIMIAERERVWNHTFSQRHYAIASKNVVIEKGVLQITFDNEEQAGSFEGCGIILGS